MSDALAAAGLFRATDSGLYRAGTDDRLVVTFRRLAVQHNVRSQAEGRPVFEAVDYVRIQQPGERDFIERPVREDDTYRWPRQWAAYQAAHEQAPDGTPLDVLFPADPHIVASLRGLQVLTVEHLAAATEAAIGRMGMGARTWVEKARQFLDAAAGGQALHALQRDLERAREELEGSRREIEDLKRAVAEMRAQTPRRGRRGADDDE